MKSPSRNEELCTWSWSASWSRLIGSLLFSWLCVRSMPVRRSRLLVWQPPVQQQYYILQPYVFTMVVNMRTSGRTMTCVLLIIDYEEAKSKYLVCGFQMLWPVTFLRVAAIRHLERKQILCWIRGVYQDQGNDMRACKNESLSQRDCTPTACMPPRSNDPNIGKSEGFDWESQLFSRSATGLPSSLRPKNLNE